MQSPKIFILLPDGIGLRNFAFTNFHQLGIENGFEIVEGGLNDSNHFGYIFNHRVRVEAGESSCYVCCKKSS